MSYSNKIVHELRMNCDHDAANLIERLQQRNAELEQSMEIIMQQRDSYRHERTALAIENEKLAATVERLRVNGAKVCLEFPDKITRTQKEFMLTVSPYGYSGQANLNHVKREVAKEAFIQGAKSQVQLRVCNMIMPLENASEEYINNKYPSVKGGE